MKFSQLTELLAEARSWEALQRDGWTVSHHGEEETQGYPETVYKHRSGTHIVFVHSSEERASSQEHAVSWFHKHPNEATRDRADRGKLTRQEKQRIALRAMRALPGVIRHYSNSDYFKRNRGVITHQPISPSHDRNYKKMARQFGAKMKLTKDRHGDPEYHMDIGS